MLIRNTKEFLKKTLQKKILCLDIGKKRIGLAISDPKHKIVTPLSIFNRDKSFYSNLLNVVREYNVGGIIIGLPLNEDGSSNRMCQFILDVSKNINNFLKKNKFELPIFFWDESYTSFEALERTYDLYKNIKSQKKTIDKFAAKIILEDFLDQI